MTLILASQSASRRAMLDAAGVAFDVLPAHIDEASVKSELLKDGADARAIGKTLAIEKALSVSRANPGRLVLGTDSIVSVGDELFDKPVSRGDAAAHLRRFSGRMMTLDSSAALARDGEIVDWRSDDAHLEVRVLSEAFIERYLTEEWPAIAACVGCFRIEGVGVQLFECVTGSHFTILGMPLLPVLAMLREQGVMPS